MPLSKRQLAGRVVCVVALFASLTPVRAGALIPTSQTSYSAVPDPSPVTVTQSAPSVAPDGNLSVQVGVTIGVPTDYLEVRLRLRSRTGRIIFQKTEIRSGLTPGRYVISYDHELASFGLSQGRYPIEVRVLSTHTAPADVEDRLLVVDPSTEPIPVAVVVSASDTPALNMADQLTRDPATDTGFQDALGTVLAAVQRGKYPVSFAIAPALIDQLGRIADGYETTSGVKVPANSIPSMSSRQVVDALGGAVSTGGAELLDVPYALPDIAGMASIGISGDLAMHWAQSDTIYSKLSEGQRHGTTAFLGMQADRISLASVHDRGDNCVLTSADLVRTDEETATPGLYSIKGAGTRLLVPDEQASDALGKGRSAFLDALFTRLEEKAPTAIVLDVGPGGTQSANEVSNALSWISSTSWLRLTNVDSITETGTAKPATLAAPARKSAPPEYWAGIADARASALGYAAAAPDGDAQAAAAKRAVLLAESSLWAGKDGAWGAANDGLALAREARDYVETQFAQIKVDAKDVRLSGNKGDVPLTLINGTGKPLKFTLSARSDSARSVSPSQDIVAQPAQNFFTVPVNLGNSLGGVLHLTLTAGGLTVAQSDVSVRAGYTDRLAMVLAVIVVLALLLLVIRRRVAVGDAGNILGTEKHSPTHSRHR